MRCRTLRDFSRTATPRSCCSSSAASAITYRVRFWVTTSASKRKRQDLVRTLHLLRASSATASPFRTRFRWRCRPRKGGSRPCSTASRRMRSSSVALFSTLTEQSAPSCSSIARPVLYAAGEAVVRQGQRGGRCSSSFAAKHRSRSPGTRGGRAPRAGDVFGEMSLLTGEARSATVTAVTDCDLLELEADGFRRVVLTNPSVLERVTAVTSARREELNRHRETHQLAAVSADTPHSLLARVRQFLRL